MTPSSLTLANAKLSPSANSTFFTDIAQAQADLDWQPKYDLVSGLKDSFQNDYLASGRNQSEIDFSLDEEILGKI